MSNQLYKTLCDIDLSLDSIYETVQDLDLVLEQVGESNALKSADSLEDIERIKENLNAVRVCLKLRIYGARGRLVTALTIAESIKD